MTRKVSFIWKIPKEEFEEVVKNSHSYSEIVKKYYNHAGNSRTIKARIKEDDIDTSHFKGQSWAKGLTRPECSHPRYTLDKILTKDTIYKGGGQQLKKRLINIGLMEDKCISCNQEPIHNGKPLVLQLDHINGDHQDNRIENLRILCPNCHSQTDTFCGKTKFKKPVEKDLIEKPVEKKPVEKKYCIDCNLEIRKKNTRCRECNKIYRGLHCRKVKNRPSKEILKKEVEETSYVSVGKNMVYQIIQ